MYKYLAVFLLISSFPLFAQPLHFQPKGKTAKTRLEKPANFVEVTLRQGALHHYVSTSTSTFDLQTPLETFIIGRDDRLFPSMDWRVGGYTPNSYLYFGTFHVVQDGRTVRFSTESTRDFEVIPEDSLNGQPLTISFLLDDSLDPGSKGISCRCTIYSWSDPLLDDFYIYEFTIYNHGMSNLNNIFCGFHADCDISTAASAYFDNFYEDDMVGMYIGEEEENPEIVSFMYDGDNPLIGGDDTGGRLDPPESLGYIGSRFLSTTPNKYGAPNGHQWWDAANEPQNLTEWANRVTQDTFYLDPGVIGDYRYLQTAGPWFLSNGDSLTVTFAFGIGTGLDGLRKNLQTAYDLYDTRNKGPRITGYEPQEGHLAAPAGDDLIFTVNGESRSENPVSYLWQIDGESSSEREATFVWNTRSVPVGRHRVTVALSDGQYTSLKHWIVEIQVPRRFALGRNFPNPFNGFTVLPFEVPTEGKVNMTIYDILGREVITLIAKKMPRGQQTAIWDGFDNTGKGVASGIYIYRLSFTPAFGEMRQQARRLLYLK